MSVTLCTECAPFASRSASHAPQMLKYAEYGLSRLFSSAKGRDTKLFIKAPAFAQFPEPTITLECPEVGPSESQLRVEHTAEGEGRFPSLRWPAAGPNVKQYLLVSEDPDAPLPDPVIHGIYYGIPPTTTAVSVEDFQTTGEPYVLKGGFKYGQNRRGNVYIPPRPLVGHGPHRYFFELVALTQPVDTSALSASPTADEILRVIDGNVAGWGVWVGVFERKWE